MIKADIERIVNENLNKIGVYIVEVKRIGYKNMFKVIDLLNAQYPEYKTKIIFDGENGNFILEMHKYDNECKDPISLLYSIANIISATNEIVVLSFEEEPAKIQLSTTYGKDGNRKEEYEMLTYNEMGYLLKCREASLTTLIYPENTKRADIDSQLFKSIMYQVIDITSMIKNARAIEDMKSLQLYIEVMKQMTIKYNNRLALICQMDLSTIPEFIIHYSDNVLQYTEEKETVSTEDKIVNINSAFKLIKTRENKEKINEIRNIMRETNDYNGALVTAKMLKSRLATPEEIKLQKELENETKKILGGRTMNKLKEMRDNNANDDYKTFEIELSENKQSIIYTKNKLNEYLKLYDENKCEEIYGDIMNNYDMTHMENTTTFLVDLQYFIKANKIDKEYIINNIKDINDRYTDICKYLDVIQCYYIDNLKCIYSSEEIDKVLNCKISDIENKELFRLVSRINSYCGYHKNIIDMCKRLYKEIANEDKKTIDEQIMDKFNEALKKQYGHEGHARIMTKVLEDENYNPAEDIFNFITNDYDPKLERLLATPYRDELIEYINNKEELVDYNVITNKLKLLVDEFDFSIIKVSAYVRRNNILLSFLNRLSAQYEITHKDLYKTAIDIIKEQRSINGYLNELAELADDKKDDKARLDIIVDEIAISLNVNYKIAVDILSRGNK